MLRAQKCAPKREIHNRRAKVQELTGSIEPMSAERASEHKERQNDHSGDDAGEHLPEKCALRPVFQSLVSEGDHHQKQHQIQEHLVCPIAPAIDTALRSKLMIQNEQDGMACQAHNAKHENHGILAKGTRQEEKKEQNLKNYATDLKSIRQD